MHTVYSRIKPYEEAELIEFTRKDRSYLGEKISQEWLSTLPVLGNRERILSIEDGKSIMVWSYPEDFLYVIDGVIADLYRAKMAPKQRIRKRIPIKKPLYQSR